MYAVQVSQAVEPLLDLIAPRLGLAEGWRSATGALGAGEDFTLATPGLVRPLAVAALFAGRPRATLVVVGGEDAADRFARQLTAYLPAETVLRFPLRTDMAWARSAPDLEAAGRRARALHTLARGRHAVVVASARSLLRALPPRDSGVFEPLLLAAGTVLDLEAASARLASMGYERVERAEERGQFAVRGGTLDVFPSDSAHPLRADLFGDEIETLRRYVPSTQQTIGESEPVEVYPCREVRLSGRAADAAERRFADEALAKPQRAHELELIREGVYFEGVESYLPVFYKRAVPPTEHLAKDALVVLAEPRQLFDDMARHRDEIDKAADAVFADPAGLYIRPAEVDLSGRQRLTLVQLVGAAVAVDADLGARRPDVSGGPERFVPGVRSLLDLGYLVAVTGRDRGLRNRLEDSVRESGLGRDRVPVVPADVPAGYVVPDAKVAVISVEDVFPRASTSGRAPARAADPTQFQFAFKPGDYVVHSTHGIALFRALERKQVLGNDRDYLVLEYAKGDKLYVPLEQLDRVTKYVGPEGGAPKVTRLNTADWSKATTKARKAAKKLAFDLVDLYSRRATVAGHRFSRDTPWQMEMEAMFPFEETPDQLAAIADVKADMESDKPMDRLVCGDVGYGKTEVAIRAAFKAVQDGSQVMVLCPTTILAQQHFTTFSERYEPFPVRVEVLSRFRTKAEQAEALKGFAEGSVDMLIGTHRLLSRDVSPKRLGLVIVDEEQRFGVEHKEHLKNLREQVDVLTMTATPIPRTLQMSLSGVRDMSVIDTPPPNRFPVQVHVGEFDSSTVQRAIRRELDRGGQVYYVSNRVRSIDEAVRRVTGIVPEARVAVAHGQMSGPQVERVMEGFAAGETDILVATTIVESGIDNPHTNTLVIEDSQRLGLGQLYQLKGRVGRSHVRAYAYFLFPRGQALTGEAYERLTAIAEHTDLGSGIQIALRDLEIRGAGSLLGAEQSGQVSSVGFELYAQMLREAISEARGEPLAALPEVRVDLPVPAFLPEDYVRAVDERVLFYRRFAGSSAPEAVARAADDLVERFGEPPEPAANLIAVAKARTMAADLGAESVVFLRGRVSVWPVTLSAEQASRIEARVGAHYAARERKVTLAQGPGRSVSETTLQALDAILTEIRSSLSKG